MREITWRARARKHPAANAGFLATKPIRLVAFGLLLAVALHAALTFQFLPSRYALNDGDVSPFDIKSPVRVTYVSQLRTGDERTRAAAAVVDVYGPIPGVAARAQTLAAATLTQIGQIRREQSPDALKIQTITSLPSVSITADVASSIVALDDLQWRDTVTTTLHLLDRVMQTRITPQQVAATRSIVPTQVDPGIDNREAATIIALTRGFVSPTEEVDAAATAQARRDAADAVQPVRVTIEKGETIVRDGVVVGATDLEKLEAAGLRNPAINWHELLAMGLLSLAASFLLVVYLYRLRPGIAADSRRLVLLGILLVVPLVAAKLTIPGRELYAYLFPLAAAPMLLAMLLDAETSLVATAIQSAALGLVISTNAELVLATLVAGGLGALWVERMERLGTLSTAATLVAASNFVVIVAFHLATGDVDPQQVILYAFLAGVSGALSAALTLGTVAFLGRLFGVATAMNLLDLAHPSQPLFRRLLNEAPGTYHHSVVVANLAERAAAAIGADTLLARIGGYYHDIGKLRRPYAFIENQVDGHNVHDQLDPHTSARIILAHVTDGIDLAEKNGIPARVEEMIAQHHGTMTIQYFYWQATKQTEETVDESAFRYAGPKPQTREAGIMMLADGVEAAVRANRDHSTENVTTIVDQIMRERVSTGQLDECDLTLADLSRIRLAFLAVLQGIYHPRVEYPTELRDLAPAAQASK